MNYSEDETITIESPEFADSIKEGDITFVKKVIENIINKSHFI